MIRTLSLPQIALLLPLLLLSLTVHEWAHAKVAFLKGDPTARDQGRLTLNPLRHIDIFGLVMLLFVGVGWAKPVPIRMERLRSPKRDLILVSLAGPASNLLIGGLFGLLARIYRVAAVSGSIPFYQPLFQVLVLVTVINGLLFFFNMLPVPPLDGSKVVGMILSNRRPEWATLYFRYGSYLLLGILIAQLVFDIPVIPFNRVTELILRLILGG